MKLYIIGAGDVGGFIARHITDFGDYEICGVLDDNQSKLGQNFCGFEVLGNLNFLQGIKEDVSAVIAVANPTAKEKIWNLLSPMPNLSFPSFVHPNAWVGDGTMIGKGTIIYPGVSINYAARIGDFCTLNMNCAIGHNCTLSTGVTLSPGVNLGGFTYINEYSFVGIGVSTLQGLTVGKRVTVGGMTMLLKDVPDGVTIVGNPGRILPRK